MKRTRFDGCFALRFEQHNIKQCICSINLELPGRLGGTSLGAKEIKQEARPRPREGEGGTRR